MSLQYYSRISSLIVAIRNCQNSGNSDWEYKHELKINELEKLLPSGSGLDCEVCFSQDDCSENELIILTDFHYMHADGYYDGFIGLKIVISASLSGLNIDILVMNNGSSADDCIIDDLLDYLSECFYNIDYKGESKWMSITNLLEV